MAFPAPTNNAHHEEGLQAFYGKDNRWLRRQPIYEHIKEWNQQSAGYEWNLRSIDEPPPRNLLEMRWLLLLGQGDLNLQIGVTEGTTWYDWATKKAAGSCNANGSLHRGNDCWSKQNWFELKTPNTHGFFVNWADGNWKLLKNHLAILDVAFHNYDGYGSNFIWTLRHSMGSDFCVTKGSGWLNIPVKTMDWVGIYTDAVYDNVALDKGSCHVRMA